MTKQIQAQSQRPLVLVIAGLDSGGGAGVTADVLTVHDQGAWALPTVTALTCQSLERVTDIKATPVDIFKESIKLARKDWQQPIKAIKVGLVTEQKILDTLLDLLDDELKGIPVIWDPVLTATAGRLESADLKKSLKDILKRTTIFTPNLPEALELADWKRKDLEKHGIDKLAQYFLDLGAEAVIIKGGHSEGVFAEDYFKSEKHGFVLKHERREGEGAHGGGCALSSALAGLVANGYALTDAAVLAKAYVTRGIFEPEVEVGHKRPPLSHQALSYDLSYMPVIDEEGFPKHEAPFAVCPEHLGIYPVVDSADWVARLLAMGVKTVQLRIKTAVVDDENDEHLCQEIKRACFLGRSFHARVFIDDHAKLAIKYGAYGVHLGMEDLRQADLDAIYNAGLRLGVSTHGIYEVCKALTLNPSYIALGHVFPTQTKEMESQPQGLAKLAYQAQMLQGKFPTVAIGGIKLKDAADVLQTSVGSIAVVTAITKAEEPCKEVQKWISVCRTGPSEFYGQEPATWQRRQDDQQSHVPAWQALEASPGLEFIK